MCDKYPSIEQFRNFVKELDYVRNETNLKPSHYNLIGTVKLHGTHADIVVTRTESSDAPVTADKPISPWHYGYQSRTRVLTGGQNDNMGFAAFIDDIPLHDRNSLVDAIECTYLTTTPSAQPISTLLIAGEWCGHGIQHSVALDKLPRMFVLYGLKIDGVWQRLAPYAHIALEAHRMYNILRVPAYHVTVAYDSIAEVLQQLQALTLEVERECPFAASLGKSGTGEGIVWVCDELAHDSRGWFKVKGDKHSVTRIPAIKDVSEDTKAKLRNTTLFAEEAVTEVRLEQGISYLRESNKPVTKASLGEYVRWVQQDTLKEEGDSMSELGLDPKVVSKAVAKRALEWFQARLRLLAATANNSEAANSTDVVEKKEVD